MKINGEIRMRGTVLLGLALFVCVSTGLAQKSKKEDQTSRSVQGVVTSPEDTPVAGAVVQIKNTKTLQIRSFIAKEDGSYYFNGLSADVDYELRAEFQGMSSSNKTLSSFDTRKAATINLKLNKK
jgi:Carboxypeptidase regulatory-like domain